MRIGNLAQHAGVNIETIRYYERRGLIPEPPRRRSGYREYTRDSLDRIRFIRRAQEVGFTLNEILELLSLRVDPETTCADIRKRAEAKIIEVEGKIRALGKMKKALNTLKTACQGRGPSSECPILDALDAENGKMETREKKR